MPKYYSTDDLHKKTSFANRDLRLARFYASDLRGVDFSGSDLSGASFVNVRTGITSLNIFLIFLGAMMVSILSGYIAMLAGSTVQKMLASSDEKIRIAGIATIIITIFFIVYCYWKGGRSAVLQMMVPLFILSVVIGGIGYFSGIGTGKGMLYEILALVLVVVMFIVGAIARATAGMLSNVLFVIVAVTGGVFGKTVGGGIGTVVMGISCALISKRALSGAKGFEDLKKLSGFFTSKLGTSFRNCMLADADFSESKIIRNSDFSNSDISFVYWGQSQKLNCIT
jgi:hypothetical protein